MKCSDCKHLIKYEVAPDNNIYICGLRNRHILTATIDI